VVVVVSVFEPLLGVPVLIVVLFSVLDDGAGDSFTIVVLFSVLFSPGGLVTVVSFFSQATSKAAPAKMQMYFFMCWFDGMRVGLFKASKLGLSPAIPPDSSSWWSIR
jgi:hypothetical protein